LSDVLAHGHARLLPGGPKYKGPHANQCMLYTACLFLMFKH
jgi:hypothetical protein